MKRLLLALVGCLSAVAALGEDVEEMSVVILAGSNNHKWQETTPVLKDILEQNGGFRVDVVLEPEQLTEERLAECDVILSNWNNWAARRKGADSPAPWSEDLRKAYVGFVKDGGGHVMVHAGSSSFFDWIDYQKICCATWKLGQTGHGPQHEFEVRMTAVEHPITQDMEAFKIKDELWHRPGVQPGVQVLAEAYCSATENWEPSAMVNRFGKGRCFALMLGHGGEQMQSPGFQELLIRGTEWAASGSTVSSDTKRRQSNPSSGQNQ